MSCLLKLARRQIQSPIVIAVDAVEWPELKMVTMLPEVDSRFC